MNKQTQTGLAIGGGVLALAIVAWFLFLRPSGSGDAPTTPTTPVTTASQTGKKGTDAASAPAFKPGSLGKVNIVPRHDPFYISWKDNTLPPPDVFADVQPIRVTPAILEEPQEEVVEVREAPSRRYSGFMNGDGVFAVLEGNGDTEIVQPGSITKGDGYKVVSITADQVFLRKQEGNVILTQVVQYGDAPPSATGGRPAGGGGFAAGMSGGGQFGGGQRGGGQFGVGAGGGRRGGGQNGKGGSE